MHFLIRFSLLWNLLLSVECKNILRYNGKETAVHPIFNVLLATSSVDEFTKLPGKSDGEFVEVPERLLGLKPKKNSELSAPFCYPFRPFLLPPFTDYGYIILCYDGRLFPPMIFGLFGNEYPKTVHNFVTLLNSHKDPSLYRKVGSYKGTLFYRIIQGYLMQGGRVINGKGIQGESIYGGYFEDEDFVVRHDRPGVLSMCSRGPDANGSEFMINAHREPSFDQMYVGFGLLIYGIETLDYIVRKVPIQKELEMPLKSVSIFDCGTDVREKLTIHTMPQ